MKRLVFYTTAIGIMVFTACRNRSAENKVAGAPLSDSAKLARATLDSTKKAAYRNNDLSIIFLEASSEIMQAQMAIEKADYEGKQAGPADSLIVNSSKGDTLYQTLMKVYDVGALYADNETDKMRFENMKLPAGSKPWLGKKFKGLTTTDAVVTLGKFQNDCNLISKIARH